MNFINWVPFYDLGIGWITPALVGIIIGWIIHLLSHRSSK